MATSVVAKQHSRPSVGRLLLTGLAAGGVSTLVNVVVSNIGRVVFNGPDEFAPFTAAPLLSGCFGGALGASAVYIGLSRFLRKPVTPFVVLSGVLLAASYSLPLRLLNTKSERFAGANNGLVGTLMVMHTVVAVTSVVLLTRSLRSPKS